MKPLLGQVLVEGEAVSSTSAGLTAATQPVKLSEQKNSFSSSVLNKLGTYLKSSTKLNESDESHHLNHNEHTRGANRRGNQNRLKSKSMFVQNDSPLAKFHSDESTATRLPLSPLQAPTKKTAKFLKKRFSLKLRKASSKKSHPDRVDSGILTDFFHLGSVSNLKQKLTNATTALRQSFSVFNLKSSPKLTSTRKYAPVNPETTNPMTSANANSTTTPAWVMQIDQFMPNLMNEKVG